MYRTFFLIRHGESKWNEAQAKINITGMLDKDHALTGDGINQACTLNARWKHASRADSMSRAASVRFGNTKLGLVPANLDFSHLDEDDLRAIEREDDEEENSDDEGAPRGMRGGAAAKGLNRLYDTFFQKYSNVTSAGKPQAAVTQAAVSPSQLEKKQNKPNEGIVIFVFE